MNPIDDFTQAAAALSTLLDRLGAGDLGRPTPCDGWNVQDLLTHLVDNTAFFAGAAGVVAAGHPPITDENVAAEFAAVAGDVVSGYGAPGLLQQDIETPFGTFAGATVLAVGVADVVTHCWDLGRALGAPVVLDDDVVEHAMAAWRAFITEDLRGDGLFGPAEEAPEGATPLDRVAAFAGRAIPR